MTLSGKLLANPVWCVYSLAFIIVLCAYSVSFAYRQGGDLGLWLGVATSSAAPLLISGVLTRYFIVRCVHPCRPWTQVLLHLSAGTVFSIALFFVLMAVLSFRTGDSTAAFAAASFRGPAAMWQFVQCASIYGLIAFTAQLEKRRQPTENIQIPSMVDSVSDGRSTEVESESDGPVFVRNGNEIVPLRTERIVHIKGARDYAEVVTSAGTHLLRISLAELERKLGSRFLRVHRSTIVNADQIDHVEPAGGGRLLLHLLNGDTVNVSRAGAKRIKERTL